MKTRSLHFVGCLAWTFLTLLNPNVLAQDYSPPEVWIGATAPETLEPSANTRVSPGEFTITRIGNTNEPLILFVEFAGTATFGKDYQEESQLLIMPAGERKLTVLVQPLDDSAVEGDEAVTATLSTAPPINSLPNYTVHPRLNHATVVVHDNDFPNDRPVVSISGPSVVLEFCPPNADCVGLEYPLRRTGPGLDQPLTVFLLYLGTAMAEVDYPALPRQVTFEAGQEFASAFSIPSIPIDDTLFEGDETIIASIVEGLDYYVDPNRRQATTVIRDNEPPAPPVVSLELVVREAMETRIDQNAILWAEFNVRRTGPATNELVVFLNTQQGSARLGEDYWLDGVSSGSAVCFAAGARAVNVRLYPIDDDFYEGDETVFFHLIAPPPGSNPYEIDFAHSSVSMVIHDNDPVTTRLDITSPRDGQHFEAGSVIELHAQIIGPGRTNSWRIEFFDGNQPIGTTQPGGAIWWQDAIGGQHVINARATDSAGVTLEAQPVVTISVGPGPALPVVSIFPQGRGQTLEPCPVCFVPVAAFTVLRTGPTNQSLNVYLEYDGPATPGQDYRELPRLFTIPAGTNSAHLLVMATDDRLAEGPEIVRASLVQPELATAGYLVSYYASQAMVVINDDEAGAPEIRLDIADPDEGAQFATGTTIEISALGVWTRGEVDQPVEFFAGNSFIGQSNPLQFERPTIPGLPSVHTIFWTNPPAGRHSLTARFAPGLGLAVTSPPVNITVGAEPPRTVVRIEATQPIAEEDSDPFDRLALVGVFTISRSGPTNQPMGVYLRYSGTATAEKDYPLLPWFVSIPEGAASTQIRVEPFADSIPEGIETLVATISNCPPPWLLPPCYDFEMDPAHQSATVFIRDDGVTRASLAITSPKDRENFRVGETIPIEATAIDLDSYISRVEFWDDARRIGVSEVLFIREPDPGTPIYHTFEWRDAAPGEHVLTARALTTAGMAVSSAPVHITVGPTSNQPPHMAITRPAAGAEFPINAPIEIVAEGRDPDGFVRKAEFFADGRKIGEQSIQFIQPPPPGQTQTFTFVWRFPAPGAHTLTARATDDDDASALSAPVDIRVTPPDLLPVITVVARDAFAVEPRTNTVLNAASFRIRRFGPTNDPLVVNYSLHGTALNGVDYAMLADTTTIPAGRKTVVVTVRPLPDNVAEGIETVGLRLEDPPGGVPPRYRLGLPSRAVALISDYPWVHPPGGARGLGLQEGMRLVGFSAEAGFNFRVEASSDLRNWETVCNTLSPDGAVHFADGAANIPYRFYRVTPEPVADADD